MSSVPTWQEGPLGQLSDHIAAVHHAYLNREMPLIVELLTTHMRQYWMKHPELMQAHSLFAQLKASLDQHLIQEETAGFPLIKAHEKDASRSLAPFVNTIDQHIQAHAEALDLLSRIRATLWNYQVPQNLGPEVSFTCLHLERLEKDLAEHIGLENDILFPRLRQLS